MKSSLQLLNISLLIALVATSLLIVGPLSGFNDSFTLPATKTQGAQPALPPSYGILIAQILLETRWQLQGRLPTHFSAISGDEILLTDSDSPESAPLIKVTNSSGLVKFILPLSKEYTLTIDDSRFHVAFPLKLSEGVTSIVVRANRLVYTVSFEELLDSQSSGWTTRFQTIVLAVQNQGKPTIQNGTVFLEVERRLVEDRTPLNTVTNPKVEEIPATILSAASTGDAMWMQVQVLKDIRLQGISRIVLVSYEPSVEVEI